MNEDNIKIIHGKKEVKVVRKNKGIFVIIDVLRASSTIINGLSNGARLYIPCLKKKEARKKKKSYPDALLAGERKAHKIKGFQLGNSPMDHVTPKVKDKIIIFTSSNCTRSVNLLLNAPVLLIGALINCTAITEVVLTVYHEFLCPIYLIAVGNNGNPHNEDSIVANVMKQLILGNHYVDLEKIRNEIWNTRHARSLIQKKYGEDVEFCTNFDSHKIVPIFKNDGFVRHKPL